MRPARIVLTPLVLPDIGAVAPVLTQFEAVHMGPCSDLEGEDQLVA